MRLLFSNHRKEQQEAKARGCAEVRSHIGELEAGKENHLAALYPSLLSGDREMTRLAAEAVHVYMNRLDPAGTIRLDRRFRQYTSMEWRIDWTKISPADVTDRIDSREVRLSVLRLGTFHPNGYFRERCMRALADDEASLPYLALRLNDWVKQVRDTAYGLLSERLDAAAADTAVEMLPFFSQAKKGRRYAYRQMEDIEEKLEKKILLHLQELSLERLRDRPPVTRRFLYRLLLTPKVLPRAEADRLLEREKNGNEKALIIRLILNGYPCSDRDVEHYLRNKSPVVRKKALEIKYGRLGGAWEGLEAHLLDTAKGIRSDACYILQKHTDFDIVAFYKEKLHTPEEAAAILGIGENGGAEDAGVLKEYQFSDRPRLVKNAMKALSGLGASGLHDVYWNYLQDSDPGMSKTAYLAVCRSGLCYGAGRLYQAYEDSVCGHVRKYLLYLLLREPSWERLPFLLQLYRSDGVGADKMQMLIRQAVRFRSVYARISKKQADEIVRILELPGSALPDGLKKEIRFDLAHITVV